jgi:hypothetical protein
LVGWDKNATKATNVANINRLMVASHYGFTIFPASMALTIRAMSIITAALFATISSLLLFSNPSLNLKIHVSLKTYQQ